MLPVVDSREDITLEQFAKKAQDKIADCLGIISTQKTSDDISKWKDSKIALKHCQYHIIATIIIVIINLILYLVL